MGPNGYGGEVAAVDVVVGGRLVGVGVGAAQHRLKHAVGHVVWWKK